MPIFQSNGKTYNIPDDKVDAFLSSKTDAKLINNEPYSIVRQGSTPQQSNIQKPTDTQVEKNPVQQPNNGISGGFTTFQDGTSGFIPAMKMPDINIEQSKLDISSKGTGKNTESLKPFGKGKPFTETIGDVMSDMPVRPEAHFDIAQSTYKQNQDWIKEVQNDPSISPEVKQALLDDYNKNIRTSDNTIEDKDLPLYAKKWLENNKVSVPTSIYVQGSSMFGGGEYVEGTKHENTPEQIAFIKDFVANTPQGQDLLKRQKDYVEHLENSISEVENQLPSLRDKYWQEMSDLKKTHPYSTGKTNGKDETDAARKDYIEKSNAITKRMSALDLAEKSAEEQKKLLAAVRDGDLNVLSQFGKQIGRDFWDMAGDIGTLGIRPLMQSVYESGNVKGLQDRMEKGELTEEDKLAMTAMSNNQAYQELMGDRRTIAQEVASGITASAPFMINFATTGGIGKAATGGAKRLLQEGIKRNFSNAIKQGAKVSTEKLAARLAGFGVNVADTIGRSSVMAAISPHTYRDMFDNMTGQVTYGYDEEGKPYYLGNVEQMDVTNALLNAWGSNTIENVSEFSGFGMEKGQVALSRLLKQRVPEVAKALSFGSTRNQFFQGVNKAMQTAGFNGTANEFLEEQVSTILHSFFEDGQAQWSDLVDPRQQFITYLTVAAIGSGSAIMNTGGNQLAKYGAKKAYNNAFQDFGTEFYNSQNNDIAGQFADAVRNGTIEEKQSALSDIVNSDLFNDKQKLTALNLYRAGLTYESYEGTKEAQVEEATQEIPSMIEENANPEMNAVVSATIAGQESPMQIIGGNIVSNEDGTINREQSDKEIYYVDADGNRQVTSIQFVENVTENIPTQDAIAQVTEQVAAPIVSQQENEEVRPYEAGEIVRVNMDGTTALLGQIEGQDEATGNYILSVETPNGIQQVSVQPRQIINEDHLQGVENGSPAIYTNEAGEQVQDVVATSPDLYAQGLIAFENGDVVPIENVIGLAQSSDTVIPVSEQNQTVTDGELPPPPADMMIGENGAVPYNSNNAATNTNEPRVFEIEEGLSAVENADGTYALDKQFAKSELKKADSLVKRLNEDYSDNGLVFETVQLPRKEASNPFEKPLWGVVARIQPQAVTSDELQVTDNIPSQPLDRNNEKPIKQDTRSKKPTPFQRRLQAVEPNVSTVRDRILYGIASGAYKFRWKDEGVSMGLARELGLTGSETERRSRISLLSNNGYTPSTLAHRIWEDIGSTLNDNDIRSEVIEVLSFISSPKQALETLESSLNTNEDAYYQEQQDAAEFEQEQIRQAKDYQLQISEQLATMDIEKLLNLADELGLPIEELDNIHTIFDLVTQLEQLEDIQNEQETNILIRTEGTNEESDSVASRSGSSSETTERTVGERNRSSEETGDRTSDRDSQNDYSDLTSEERRIVDETNALIDSEINDVSTQLQQKRSELNAAKKRIGNAYAEDNQTNLFGQEKTSDTLFDAPRDFSQSNVTNIIEPIQQEVNALTGKLNDLNNSRNERINEALENFRSQRTIDFETERFAITETGDGKYQVIDTETNEQKSRAYANRKSAEKQQQALYEALSKSNKSITELEAYPYFSKESQDQAERALSVLDSFDSSNITLQDANKIIDIISNKPVPFFQVQQSLDTKSIMIGNQDYYTSDYLKKYILYSTKDVPAPGSTAEKIIQAEQETNTNPTEAQKEAGNYKKGKVNIQGFDISIEQPRGSERTGTDENGKDWSITMNNTYGYILNTEGKDGDHIDVFLGNNPESQMVYVVDQVNPNTGQFDEHKVMMGFDSIEDARRAYLSNYEEGWKGLGNITGVDVESFRKWTDADTKRIKPFSEYKDIKDSPHFQSSEKVFTPVSEKTFNELVDRLKQTGLARDVITDKAAFDEKLNEASLTMRTKAGDVYGFVAPDGTVYLDSTRMNANTPIHEFGHLWVDFIQQQNPDLYQTGENLILDSVYWDKVQDNPHYSTLTQEQQINEAMAMAIGDKGASIVNDKGVGQQLLDWIQSVWAWIGDKIGIRDLNSSQLQDLTLSQFTELAAADLLSGKDIANIPAAPKSLSKQEISEMERIKQSSIDDGSFMKAPNGEPTNLTERQWLQVRTTNFKDWFGDWQNNPENASKIVDENGEPKVVFHGTTHQFYEFTRDRGNVENHFGIGYYFSDSLIDIENNYLATGADLTSRIDRLAEQLEDNEDLSPEEAMERAEEELKGNDEIILDVYLNMRYPMDVRPDAMYYDALEVYDEENDEYTENEDSMPMELYNALNNIQYDFESADAQSIWNDVSDAIGGSWDGVSAYDVDKALRSAESVIYIEDGEGNLASNEFIRSLYEEMGYDGIIMDADLEFGNRRESGKSMDMDSDTSHYIMFDPSNIKSATENKGDFNRDMNDIRFQSVNDVADAAESTMTEEVKNKLNKELNKTAHKIAEAWFDRWLPVKKLLQTLEKSGLKIEDHNNWYLRADAVASSIQSQYEGIFYNDYMLPLLESISSIESKGYTLRDIENYAMLKGGLERNELKRSEEIEKYKAEHPNATKEQIESFEQQLPSDYAGVTAIEEEFGVPADKYISDFEQNVGDDLIAEFWKKKNAATNYTLKRIYEAGGISKSEYDKLLDIKYYIPLRGHDIKTAEDLYDYAPNMGVYFSNPMIKANGRRTRAENPFAYIDQMGLSAIKFANWNSLNQSLYRLAAKDKTNTLTRDKAWYVQTGISEDGTPIWESQEPAYSENTEQYRKNQDEFEKRMLELQKEGLAMQQRGRFDLGGLFIKPAQREQHRVSVWVNGNEHSIYINANPAIARSINATNLKQRVNDEQYKEGILKAAYLLNEGLGKTQRWMANNITSKSPEFLMRNLMRDVIQSATILPVKEGLKYEKDFLTNLPKSAAALSRYLVGKSNISNPTDAALVNFFLNGGATGYVHFLELQKNQKKINKEISDLKKSNFVKTYGFLKYIPDSIEAANKWAENLSRFAVYLTSMQQGRSIARSISDAKEVTVNFNRTGSGKMGNSLLRNNYMFINPALQAMYNMAGVASKNRKKFTALTIAFGSLGFIAPMLALMIGGDDGWDEYWNLSEWDRQNNFCIYTGNGFVKISLPQELRVFTRIGDNLFSAILGKKDKTEASMDSVLGFADLSPVNPLGASTDDLKNLSEGGLLAKIMPDRYAPFVELAVNKNFADNRIYNQYADKNSPGHKQSLTNKKGDYKSPDWLVDFSKALNDITGGDDVSRGVISLNPDKINHLLRVYLGGMYTTAAQAADVTNRALDPDKKVEIRNTPLRALYISSDDIQSRGNPKYFDIQKDVDKKMYEIKGYQKEVEQGKLGIDDFVKKLNSLNHAKILELDKRIKQIKKYESALKEMDGQDQKDLEKIISNLKKEVIEMDKHLIE